jgi:hypothetical protein
MDTGHEPLKRSRGGDPTDPAQVLAACHACNDWIELFPDAATLLGLNVSRYEGRRMNTNELETSIVGIGENTPLETLLAAGDAVARLGEFQRDLKAQWEQKMIARIDATGPIVCGDIIYTVKTPPKTTCVDVPGTVRALLEHVGGDFDALCSHLSTGAIKHGAAKSTLPPEEFERLFIVEREQKLNADEATPRRLNKLNQKYING